jgi:hypothetical protein
MIVSEQAERLTDEIARQLDLMVEFPTQPGYSNAVARLIHELICHELQTGTNLHGGNGNG